MEFCRALKAKWREAISDKELCIGTIVVVLVFVLVFYWIWTSARHKGPGLLERVADARNGVRDARTPWERSTSLIFGLFAISKGGIGGLLAFFTFVIGAIVPAMCNLPWFEALRSIIMDYVKQMLSGGVPPTPKTPLSGTGG